MDNNNLPGNPDFILVGSTPLKILLIVLLPELSINNNNPVEIKMTSKAGGLFSADGKFALTIVDDSIGFWKVEPTSERKLLTPVSFCLKFGFFYEFA